MADDDVIPAAPLLTRIKNRGEPAEFCRALRISPQTLNNWRKRGVPLRKFPAVCKQIGVTQAQYRREAGLALEDSQGMLPVLDAGAVLPLIRQLRANLDALEGIVNPVPRQISAPGYKGPDRRARDRLN